MKTLLSKVPRQIARSLALLLVVWMAATEAQANYLYQLKLKNVDTGVVSDWTHWIQVTEEDKGDGWGLHWHNSLRDYIENRKEVHDNLGGLIPCRYKDGYGHQKWCDDADESSFQNQMQYLVVGLVVDAVIFVAFKLFLNLPLPKGFLI